MLGRFFIALRTPVRAIRAVSGILLGLGVMFVVWFGLLLIPSQENLANNFDAVSYLGIILPMALVTFGWWFFGTNGLFLLSLLIILPIWEMVFKKLSIFSLTVWIILLAFADYLFGKSFRKLQGIDSLGDQISSRSLFILDESWKLNIVIFVVQIFPLIVMAIFIFLDSFYREQRHPTDK